MKTFNKLFQRGINCHLPRKKVISPLNYPEIGTLFYDKLQPTRGQFSSLIVVCPLIQASSRQLHLALLPTFLNKVLLIHRHACSFTYIICGCLQLQRIEQLLQETVWRPKIFTIWAQKYRKGLPTILNCAKLYLFPQQRHFQEFTFRKQEYKCKQECSYGSTILRKRAGNNLSVHKPRTH